MKHIKTLHKELEEKSRSRGCGECQGILSISLQKHPAPLAIKACQK